MAKGFLVMSNFARDQLMSLYHIPEERIFHFPHPHFQPLLDRYVASPGLQSRLEEWAAGRPIIGFFANLTAEHGLDDLLEALPALRELLGDFRLLLISRLSAMDQSQALLVEERLAQLGLLEQCWRQWESYSYEDLKAYLEITTVAVAPYRWATQSGVVAMLAGAGIPVVATAVGGLPEMIRPGETGELVPPGNARALAQGLVRVISRAGEYRGRTRAHARAAFAPEKAAAVVVEALGAMGD
jgi:glycosyltransferase involved in cell wall biosynthesis